MSKATDRLDKLEKMAYEQGLIIAQIKNSRHHKTVVMDKIIHAAEHGDTTTLKFYTPLSEMFVNFKEYKRKAPPLGIMPKKIFLENRRKDIIVAMHRYAYEDKHIPSEWVREVCDIDKWLTQEHPGESGMFCHACGKLL